MTRWIGKTKCDFCGNDCTKEKRLYDAKTSMGPWGVLCSTCFRFFGAGLGTGRGQEYVLVNGVFTNDRRVKH